MRIDTEKLRAFFKKSGKIKETTWDENIYVPINKTIQPDQRLSFNETFIHIHKTINHGN